MVVLQGEPASAARKDVEASRPAERAQPSGDDLSVVAQAPQPSACCLARRPGQWVDEIGREPPPCSPHYAAAVRPR